MRWWFYADKKIIQEITSFIERKNILTQWQETVWKNSSFSLEKDTHPKSEIDFSSFFLWIENYILFCHVKTDVPLKHLKQKDEKKSFLIYLPKILQLFWNSHYFSSDVDDNDASQHSNSIWWKGFFFRRSFLGYLVVLAKREYHTHTHFWCQRSIIK